MYNVQNHFSLVTFWRSYFVQDNKKKVKTWFLLLKDVAILEGRYTVDI